MHWEALDLTNQSRLLQTRLSEIQRRLSCWTDIDNINNVDHLGQMEDSLKESLNQIRAHRENLRKQQLLPLECTSQFQNEMHVPLRMGIEQQLQSLAWIPNNDRRPMALPEDPNLIPHRDVECSASSSFGSYSGYFSTPKSSELSSSGQENGILNDLQLEPDMTRTKAVGLLLLALVLLPYLMSHYYIHDIPATNCDAEEGCYHSSHPPSRLWKNLVPCNVELNPILETRWMSLPSKSGTQLMRCIARLHNIWIYLNSNELLTECC
ncbi:hypothetical protein HRI_004138000 [Hibiscus trionum]|uniref:Uncharacterized protein n=1 Tax=Hibiscus trionum TaxID=183268 RepID=A0A9W7MHN4_HIBTR|nr:hypothetical protein HRI_004138000 [Hibiscus trionum]